jgi:TonB family protein
VIVRIRIIRAKKVTCNEKNVSLQIILKNMTHGRKVCNTLKEIRRQIADKNEIAYTTAECHFEGECKGTCPKCEAEVQYLENELHKRTQLGKAVAVAGISLGVAGTFAGCGTPKRENTTISEQKISAELAERPDTLDLYYPIRYITMGFIAPEIVEVNGIVEEFDTNKKNTNKDNVFLPSIYIEKDFFDTDIKNATINTTKSDEEEKYFIGGIGDEELVKYPGGEEALQKFLQENLVYPPEAKEKGIEGKVDISFVVKEDGSISEVKVTKSSGNSLLDKEAVRVIKIMPKWEQSERRPVRMRFQLPIEFSLKD